MSSPPTVDAQAARPDSYVYELVLPPFQRLMGKHDGMRVHEDPYHGPFEAYHHHLTSAQTWDLADIARVADEHPGPFLDIGCGRGRLALPLVRAGHSVTAIDSSAQALARLRGAADPDLLDSLHLVTGDVRDTALLPPSHFTAAALADLSLNLFATADALHGLLSAVRRCLRADGVLCMPVLRAESIGQFVRMRGVTVNSFTDDTGRQRLIWTAMRFDPDGPHFCRTLFLQDDNAPDGSIRGHVTAVRERLWTIEALQPHVTAAGMRITERHPLTVPAHPEPLTADLVVLQRA